MSSMIDTLNGALMMKQDMMLKMRESPHVVRQGLMVVLLVGLIVGGIQGIQSLLGGLNPARDIETLRDTAKQSIDENALNTTSVQQRQILSIIKDNLDSGIDIAENIIALPTKLPRPVVAVVRGLAVLFSTPTSYLGSVLLIVILTHSAAFWLGGQGNIQQMLGLGVLSVAPHAMDALVFVPVIGFMLQTLATLWGFAILVVATSIAHKFQLERAILAVLFFPFVGLILLLVGCCALFGLMVILGVSAS
jgi:hypothetical protein